MFVTWSSYPSTTMLEIFDELRKEIEETIIDSAEAVEAFRVAYLGRKNGRIKALSEKMRDIDVSERPVFGKHVNALKELVNSRLDQAQALLKKVSSGSSAEVDLTLPGRRPTLGSLHPLTETAEEIQRIFLSFGFTIAEGPEIEDDWHNFTSLNFPPDHPARDMQDTFFLREKSDDQDAAVLRTHTSPVQIRVMKASQPPIRVIAPGRVYRNETITFKSYCVFHQVEGLYVDEGVSLADLKQVLHMFARAIFGDDVKTRFRPSFFPFTEPSAEFDVWMPNSDLPAGGRWLEILGCGMVDPNVLEAVNIDSERYTGYAFGMGVERIAMLRYGIKDLRIFYENDVRFLEQF